jgi:hypothetical protein
MSVRNMLAAIVLSGVSPGTLQLELANALKDVQESKDSGVLPSGDGAVGADYSADLKDNEVGGFGPTLSMYFGAFEPFR